MATKQKRGTLEALPETCGCCRHGHDVSGQVFLLCYGLPPLPVVNPEGEVVWAPRGGAVEPIDPACAFFSLKGRA